jgi:hypothetical protein
MFAEIDAIALLACSLTWLGPFAWNAAHGRVRLIHPIGLFPIIIVHMMITPLHFRLSGQTMLRTSALWADNPWYLAGPMLWMALFGLFYHLGVRLAGVSLVLSDRDKVDAVAGLPLDRRTPPAQLALAALISLGFMVAASVVMPREHHAKGYFFMHVFFTGYQILPVLVLASDRKLGQVFLLIAAPVALLMRSKAAFLYMAINLVLFFQGRLLRLSRFATLFVIGLVLLTPLAVARYATVAAYREDMVDPRGAKWVGWDDTMAALESREYAFEAFVCVWNWRRQGHPWTYGSTLLGEGSQMVPTAFWPDKPFKFHDFPSTYLPRDYRGLEIHYARHLATIFFLDFDIPGCCIGFLATGLLFGACYGKALRVSLRRKESWPMVLYLAWVVHAKYLVDGGFAGSIPNTIGSILGILMTLRIGRWLTGNRRERTSAGPITDARPTALGRGSTSVGSIQHT